MPVGCNATLGRTVAVTKLATGQGGNVGVHSLPTLSFTRPVTITAATSPSAKLQRFIARALAAAQPQTATLLKRPLKPFAVTVSPAATLARSKVYAIVLSTQQHVGHGVAAITLVATQAQAATLTALRVVRRTVTATQPQTAALQRQPGKTLRTGSMLALPPIFQSVATSAVLVRLRTPGKVLSATVGQAPTLRRQAARELDAAQPQTATITRLARRVVVATQGQAAALTKFRGVPLNAVAATAVRLQRQAQTTLAAVQETQASVTLQPGVTLTATAGSLADLALQKVAKVAEFAATVGQDATLRRDVQTTLAADATVAAATLTKLAAASLATATVGQGATFAIGAAKELQAFQAQAATLRRNLTIASLRATVAPVAVLLRNPHRILTLRATVKARARFFTDHPALYGIIRAGRIAVAEVGHIAHAVRGRVETIIERLS